MKTKKIPASFCGLLILLTSFSAMGQGYGSTGGSFSLRRGRAELGKQQGGSEEKNGKKEGEKSFRGVTDMGDGIEYQIHLLGQLETPGTYRVAPSTRLDEALGKAGAILDGASKRRVEVRREGRTLQYDLFKFQRFGDLKQNPFLMDNDVVFVPYIGNSVSIKGPVKSSGVYELLDNEKSLWDLVDLAGGYAVGLSEKDPVTVVRFENGKRKVLKVASVQSEMERFELLNGDVVVIPHFLAENRHFDYNVTDLPADSVYFPTNKNEVYVTGAVGQPGAFVYNPSNSIRDFVNMAGPTELSQLKSIYVLTADGRYVKASRKKFRLSPGDTVVVPKRSFTTDNVLKWYGTFTSTIFTSFAMKELLRGF